MIGRDDQYPFAELPEGKRGVIGLPVLLALQTIRLNREKRLETSIASPRRDSGGAALALDAVDLVAEVEIEGHRVAVVFDSGEDESAGLARLATDFPELLKNSRKGTDTVSGFSGKGSFESEIVPALRWKIGGFSGVSRDTAIYMKNGPGNKRYYARLGADLLSEASEVTIDFQRMRLLLEGSRR
jgi:hypothetical protein